MHQTLAVEEVGLALVDGIFSREDGDLKSITPPSLLIMSARPESAEHNEKQIKQQYSLSTLTPSVAQRSESLLLLLVPVLLEPLPPLLQLILQQLLLIISAANNLDQLYLMSVITFQSC